MPDLGSTISLNASKFAAGVAETRAKLVELNTALIENRNKMKELNKEALELQKQEKALSDSMKDGGTKEQQKELEQLRVRIGQVNTELGTLKTRERELQSDIRKTSNELETQKNDTNQLAGATDTATAAIKKLETGLKAVLASAAGKKLYEVLIGSNAEMEQYLTSFEVMLGDVQKAKDLMSELNTMAAKTPMELTDVVSSGTLLMNYGVDSGDLIDTMTKLGDLAAGNAQKFERVSLAYGQMLAKGKVSGEELRQMTEAGVPLLQALADELGVTSGEMQDLVSKGKIGIPELNAAITSMTTGTGQFAGMMEKQSQTFSGMLSTLSDEAQQFGRDVGEEAFGVAKEALSDLMKQIDEWKEDGTLDELKEDLGGAIGDLAHTLKDVFKWLVENREAVVAAVNAFIALKSAMAIKDVATSASKAFKDTTKNIQNLSIAAKDFAKAAAPSMSAAFAGASAGTLAFLSGVLAVIPAIALYQDAITKAEAEARKLIGEHAEEVKALNEEMSDSIIEQQKLQGVIDEYDRIKNTVSDTKEQKEELAVLQEKLNDLYKGEKENIDLVNGSYEEQITLLGKLSEEEKTRKEAEISAAINKANEAIKEASAHQIPISFDWKGVNEEFENELSAVYKIFEGRQLKLIGGRDDERNLLITGNIYEQVAALNAIKAAMEKTGATTGEYAEKYLEVCGYVDQLNGLISDKNGLETQLYKLQNGLKSVIEDTDDAQKAAEKYAKALEDTAAAEEELTKQKDAVKSLVTEYSALYSSLKDLQDGNALSYDKMQELLEIYPELSKYIRVTADGYSVEIGALDDLSTALNNNAETAIEAERVKTEAALAGSRERLAIYNREMSEAARMGDFKTAREKKADYDRESGIMSQDLSLLDSYDTLLDYFRSGKGSKSGGGNKKEEPEPVPPGLKSLMSYAKTASAAFKEMNDNEELALTTVQALIDAGYESALDYDEATGKWTLDAEAYRTAANKQIDAAKGVEGTTTKEIKALDTLANELDKVTAGTYGVVEAKKELQKPLELGNVNNDFTMLSKAVIDQKEGDLSPDTISKLTTSRYSAALEVDVEGKIKLNTDKLQEVIGKELADAISNLKEKLKTAEEGDVPGLNAQIKAFENLKDVIKDVTDGIYGVEKAEEKVLEDTVFKAEAHNLKIRLANIETEMKAKQKLRDETLKAIDDEVQARKRLTEDNDIQRQIDQAMAQLKYSQLDEFSQAQLQRKIQSLQNEKADMLWERGIEDRRAAANEEYNTSAEQLNNEKESINNALEVLRELNNTVDTGLTDLGETIKAAIEEIVPGSAMHLTFNNTDNMSVSQIIKLVSDYFGITAVI